ncbi:NADase-type glycan-binding domain-containing protein [Flavivirga eckloniae]|uniref:NAD glycohydrolase translocation F5/8 type C domain-containing protein n=1 Tax=Flavivirga eckloniae TaxID=1803846 RepID=A0A2K9PUK4_9FLAO|nr:hypothetical protein [Flavivirga eckloniae]AUP80729.1 hypothetical protein C1H87_19220 [Flavivirga eckloniae]
MRKKITLLITISLCLLLPFKFLNAQDFVAKIGFMEEVHIFDGAFYEVYKTIPLKPKKVDVSSSLKSNTNKYKKANLLDKDPKTAWVEGVKGNGIGEKIRFSFDMGTHPDVITFTPGYFNTEDTWYKNNRVSKFKIKFLTIEDDAYSRELLGEIIVSIPKEPTINSIVPNIYSVNVSSIFFQNMPAEEFEIVEFEIIDVDSTNAKYNDTCISEIGFYQHDDTKMIKTISYKDYEKKQ